MYDIIRDGTVFAKNDFSDVEIGSEIMTVKNGDMSYGRKWVVTKVTTGSIIAKCTGYWGVPYYSYNAHRIIHPHEDLYSLNLRDMFSNDVGNCTIRLQKKNVHFPKIVTIEKAW